MTALFSIMDGSLSDKDISALRSRADFENERSVRNVLCACRKHSLVFCDAFWAQTKARESSS